VRVQQESVIDYTMGQSFDRFFASRIYSIRRDLLRLLKEIRHGTALAPSPAEAIRSHSDRRDGLLSWLERHHGFHCAWKAKRASQVLFGRFS